MSQKGHHCGPGYECLGCNNLTVQQIDDDEDVSTDKEVPSDFETASPGESSDDGLEAEVITDEFPFTVKDIMQTIDSYVTLYTHSQLNCMCCNCITEMLSYMQDS